MMIELKYYYLATSNKLNWVKVITMKGHSHHKQKEASILCLQIEVYTPPLMRHFYSKLKPKPLALSVLCNYT